MTEVVENGGNILLEESTETVYSCEKLCDYTDGCASFKYCNDRDPTERSCFLSDQTLSGNEPTILVEHCASYYTAGIHIYHYMMW